MDIHRAFQTGAQIISRNEREYTTLHKAHGIEQQNWDMLTQNEYWSPDQAMQMRSILASVAEVAMTIAGMPAVPLPGQYIAALISEVVSPCNRMLACVKAPDTFDAIEASGILGTHEVKPMSREQLMALTIMYSGQYKGEPKAHLLPVEVGEEMKKATKK